MTESTKRCSRCGREYPATAEWFKKDKRTRSGLAGICKWCAADYTRSWYKSKVAGEPADHTERDITEPEAQSVIKTETPSQNAIDVDQEGVKSMAGWAQTIIVGNVGRDPVLRYTQSGIAVCDFTVAVTRRFGGRDEGEKREKTTWYRVTCWRQQAEIANQYIRKGSQVMVVGEASVSSYLDKSGQPAATLELTASTFQLLGRRDDAQQAGAVGGYEEFTPPPDDLNDIPF